MKKVAYNNLVSEILKNIQDDDLEDAFVKLLDNVNDPHETDVISSNGRYNSIKKEKSSGTINPEVYSREKENIRQHLLHIVKTIKKEIATNNFSSFKTNKIFMQAINKELLEKKHTAKQLFENYKTIIKKDKLDDKFNRFYKSKFTAHPLFRVKR